jgi:hypothetical protein
MDIENNLELQQMQTSTIIYLMSQLSIQTNQLVKNILIVTSITITLVICILLKLCITPTEKKNGTI